MKRIIWLVMSVFLSLALFSSCTLSQETTEYLRIHIRANSSNKSDQDVKYKVKDEVVEYLTPVIANSSSKAEVIRRIENQKDEIKTLIDDFLRKNGYAYSSTVGIKNEKFPTRVYEDTTLPEGYYDAIIINLGSGKGENWWCVVYPPLCFTGGKDVKYRSKILEIIEKFKST